MTIETTDAVEDGPAPEPDEDGRPDLDGPDLANLLKRIDRRISEEWPGLAGELRRDLPGKLEGLADLSQRPLIDALDVALDRAESFKSSLDDAREALSRLHSVEGLADAIGQLDDEAVQRLADRVDRLDARASVGHDRGSRP